MLTFPSRVITIGNSTRKFPPYSIDPNLSERFLTEVLRAQKRQRKNEADKVQYKQRLMGTLEELDF